jgi:hypothetical protein
MLMRIGQHTTKLSSIKAPGDIAARQQDPRVIKLANSLEATGGELLHPIGIDKDHRLVWGRDRLAALLLADIDRARVEVVSGDDADLKRAAAIENYHRRQDNMADLARELVALEQAEPPEPEPEPEKPKRGRPKTPKGRAIDKAAEKLGTTPSAVRNAVARAEAAEETKPTLVLESWGQEVPPGIQRAAERTHGALSDLRASIRHGVKMLGYLEAEGRLFPRIREGLHLAASDCTAELPAALCHACKGIEYAMARCMTCGQRGFVGRGALVGAPEDLLKRGNEAGIFCEGHWYTMEQARRLK